jgi:hypothetical protein
MGVTIGLGSVWVATLGDLRLRRIDPETDSVTAVVDLPFVAPEANATPLATASGETAFATVTGASAAVQDMLPVVAIGAGSVWVVGVPGANVVLRVDPGSGAVVGTIRLPAAATGIVSGAAGMWVTTDAGVLVGIDTVRTRLRTVVKLGRGRIAAAAGADATWASSSDGRIVRIDRRGRITTTVHAAGGGPIAVAGGSVWARSGRTLIQIDERTARVTDRRDIATSSDSSLAWALPSIVALDYGDTGALVAPREARAADTSRTLWIGRPERGEVWRIQTPGR